MPEVHVKPQSDGLFPVYDVEGKTWRRIHTVDAREQLERGLAVIDGPGSPPPPRHQRLGAKVRTTTSGQRIEEEPEIHPSERPGPEDEGADGRPRLDGLNTERLRALAEAKGIQGAAQMSKLKLLDILSK